MKQSVVAKILGPHGLKGGVKLQSFTENPKTVLTLPMLWDEQGQEYRLLRHQCLAEEHIFIAYFEGIETRNQTEALGKRLLSVPLSTLAPIEEEETFYYAQLEGLAVRDLEDTEVGVVLAVHNFGGGDILEIQHAKGTWMVLFSHDFVGDVSLEQGFLRLTRMPE